MDCKHVHTLLSAYHDGELSAESRTSVAEHVQICSRCGEELILFGKLSGMAEDLTDPDPPQEIWASIEAGLDADPASAPITSAVPPRGETARKWRLSLLATAALVFVATGIVWFATTMRQLPSHHGELVADFEQYLERFNSNPETAQNLLLAKYDGQSINITEATRQLGYRPAVAAGLPRHYAREAMYVLEMPCCKCVQTICRRDDGRVFAIFEHREEQPVWYGDRTQRDTVCNGCPCSVMESERGLVASWNANRRRLTVVGAQDLEEIADLITHFQSGDPEV